MTARRGAEQVPLGPPRHRAVLGLLLIRLGQVVPADQLVDELWGDSLPRRPQATLQTYLSHLRRVLTGRHGPIAPLRYQAPGYVLTVEPGAFDLSRFESLVSQGQRHVADSRVQDARDVFDQALQLWRADPFLDLAAYTPLAEEAARLSLLRTTAVAAHADTLLALGEAGDAVATRRDTDAAEGRDRWPSVGGRSGSGCPGRRTLPLGPGAAVRMGQADDGGLACLPLIARRPARNWGRAGAMRPLGPWAHSYSASECQAVTPLRGPAPHTPRAG
ncbi:AfsR/SARP family transcriptional regulator [Streptomyces sp. NPDC003233]